MKNVYLVSLGCARNLVDSEMMLGLLAEDGLSITQAPTEADIIIVNTCSFIEPAVNESIDTILEFAKYKKTGACRYLIVTGCLPERYRENIVQSLPEVDIFLGTGAFDKIIAAIRTQTTREEGSVQCLLPDPNLRPLQKQAAARVRSSPHMAYLKISDGCGKHCTYCMIPKLRGKQKSRPAQDIVSEAQALISTGVKELILIAQDTTSYGKDLHPAVPLSQLLVNLADISENIWIRMLYGHPQSIDETMLRTVAMRPNICSYFDIPIQHASNRILKRMARDYSKEDLYRLIDQIRSRIPDAAIRTTVMLGFPGESDADFAQLMSFIEEIRFDHLGGFVYSDSENISSHRLSGRVPEAVAQDRYHQMMTRQKEISRQSNRRYIGKRYMILVEEALPETLFKGRTFFQAPEVDGVTYIRHARTQTGCFTEIKITDAREYDLIGEAV